MRYTSALCSRAFSRPPKGEKASEESGCLYVLTNSGRRSLYRNVFDTLPAVNSNITVLVAKWYKSTNAVEISLEKKRL
jgi:hypothetical protein